MNDNLLGIIVLLGIISIALFGGSKNATQHNSSIESQIRTAQQNLTTIQQEIQKNNESPYKGMVHLQYISRSSTPSQEYAAINLDYSAKENVPVTGWRIASTLTGVNVTIPKASYLYFQGSGNVENAIYMQPGDTVYVVSGYSPLGIGFLSNKCTGYLSSESSSSFTPYLSHSCPAPNTEDMTGIPKNLNSVKCFDYIDSLPQCPSANTPRPIDLSPECNTFIDTKLNYDACVAIHKGDSDFRGREWRTYLNHTEPIWSQYRRETITLYDANGKVVDSIQY